MTSLFLAATDFSENARHAAYRAAILARENGARLLLLHVVNLRLLTAAKRVLGIAVDIDERLVSRAEAELAAVIEQIEDDTGVVAAGRVAVGDVVDEIAGAGEEAALVVLGAHGSTGLGDLLLGSTAERVLRRVTRPVLVVKKPAQGTYRRALAPVAFGPYSANALQSLLALTPETDVIVFHAFSVPYEASLQLAGLTQDEVERYRQGARAEALSRLQQLIGTLGAAGSRFRRKVEHGNAAHLILAQADEDSSDLIVIGRQGDSVLQEVLLGSVTRHILSGAGCDVLVVGAEPIELSTTAD